MTIGQAVVQLVSEAKFSRRCSKTGLARIRKAASVCDLNEKELQAVLWACEYPDYTVEKLDGKRTVAVPE